MSGWICWMCYIIDWCMVGIYLVIPIHASAPIPLPHPHHLASLLLSHLPLSPTPPPSILLYSPHHTFHMPKIPLVNAPPNPTLPKAPPSKPASLTSHIAVLPQFPHTHTQHRILQQRNSVHIIRIISPTISPAPVPALPSSFFLSLFIH